MMPRTSPRLCSRPRSVPELVPPANCQRSTSASSRFQSALALTKVPRFCRASTIPLAARTFSDSRSAVRPTSNSLCNATRSSVAPSEISPLSTGARESPRSGRALHGARMASCRSAVCWWDRDAAVLSTGQADDLTTLQPPSTSRLDPVMQDASAAARKAIAAATSSGVPKRPAAVSATLRCRSSCGTRSQAAVRIGPGSTV